MAKTVRQRVYDIAQNILNYNTAAVKNTCDKDAPRRELFSYLDYVIGNCLEPDVQLLNAINWSETTEEKTPDYYAIKDHWPDLCVETSLDSHLEFLYVLNRVEKASEHLREAFRACPPMFNVSVCYHDDDNPFSLANEYDVDSTIDNDHNNNNNNNDTGKNDNSLDIEKTPIDDEYEIINDDGKPIMTIITKTHIH